MSVLKIPLVRDTYVDDVCEMISNVLAYEDVDIMFANVLMKKRVRARVLIPQDVAQQVLLADWSEKVFSIANAMYEEDMLVVHDTVHDLHLS